MRHFGQGLDYLLRQKWLSEKEIQYCLEIITCDPSIFTIIDHHDLTVSNLMENCIGLKRVNYAVYVSVLIEGQTILA